MSMSKEEYWFVFIGLCVMFLTAFWGFYCLAELPSVAKSDTVYVERIVEKRDSFPVEKIVRVIGKAKIPAVKPTDLEDSCKNEREEVDSSELEVVQKKYSDDSTYTAYVSGLRYEGFPKLDSVIVRQKIVERTITNTVERRGLKIKIRPAVGGGYDPLNKGWGVYVGGAVVLDW